MEQSEAMQVIALLKSAFPHVEFPAESVRLYGSAIRDLPFDLAKVATMNLISQPGRRFMPTIGEIREAALDALDTLPTAEESWREVVDQIRKTGSYGIPEFSHSLVKDAVDTMGWKDLCMSPADKLGVSRAHFFRIYDSLKIRQREDALMLPEARKIMRQIVADAGVESLPSNGDTKHIGELFGA